MEELIKQAFLHIDVIGPHVADGHYDLIGPNGDIILPQVWETTVEPDWAITMKMWPLPEPPPPAPAPAPPDKPAEAAAPGSEAAAAAKPADAPDQVVLVEPGKSPKEVKSNDVKAPPPPPPPPVPAPNGKGPGAAEGVIVVGTGAVAKKAQQGKLPPLLAWTAGTRARQSKKAEKKPEETVSHVQPRPPPPPPQQHDDVCRLM